MQVRGKSELLADCLQQQHSLYVLYNYTELTLVAEPIRIHRHLSNRYIDQHHNVATKNDPVLLGKF